MRENQAKTGSRTCPEGSGALLDCAPLAVPYVPMQPTDAKQYSSQEALSQGTLFPGLNLPFFVKPDGTPVPKTPSTELQALEFAVQELGLYLDTHPEDAEAFALFQAYVKLMQEGKQRYVAQYGPLVRSDTANFDHYVWVHDPWPWDLQGGDC